MAELQTSYERRIQELQARLEAAKNRVSGQSSPVTTAPADWQMQLEALASELDACQQVGQKAKPVSQPMPPLYSFFVVSSSSLFLPLPPSSTSFLFHFLPLPPFSPPFNPTPNYHQHRR